MQVDRPPGIRSHDETPDLFGSVEKTRGVHKDLAILGVVAARLDRLVGGGEGSRHRVGGEVPGREAPRIQQDAECRGSPPIRRVSETSGTSLTWSSTWAAIRRKVYPSTWSLHRVRARMGTSSMERGLMMGFEAPGGMRSKLE